jgi:CHRD domain
MLAKGRRSLAVFALSVLGALLLALPASSVTPAGGTSGADPLATLRAELTGEKEVPGPGDPDGSGTAVVKVFRAKVCYTLKVENIETANAAHIHLGLRNEAGPVVAPLELPTDGSSRACTQIPRALSLELREHAVRYYVNVHNEEFPNGAVRGQLHR